MRLTLLAHGDAAAARTGVFGAPRDPLVAGRRPPAVHGTIARGPETACADTAALLGAASAPVHPGLAGPDFGDWAGTPVADLAATNPAGLRAWLTSADAVPPGGESLAQHLHRVATQLDGAPFAAGAVVLVVSPLTARAACVHALCAGPQALFHLDVGPYTRAVITGGPGSWRLRSLTPDRG